MASMFVAMHLVLLAVLMLHAAGQELNDKVYISREENSKMKSVGGNSTVVLGGLFPVHNHSDDNACGTISDLGVQTLEAMVLAIDSINRDTSLLPGVALEFEIRDTCSLTNKALEQSLEYVCTRNSEGEISNDANQTGNIRISGVVGAAYSRSSKPVARLLRLFQLPQISYASTAISLSDKTTFDYFFRTIPSDLLQARAMADIVEYFKWTYVIAIHTGDTYGIEGMRAFVDELEKRNSNSTKRCIAGLRSIEIPNDSNDVHFEQVVSIIDRDWVRNATVVILFVQLETAKGVLKAVGRERKNNPEFAAKNFTWIGSDGWGDGIPVELHELAHGSLSIVPKSQRNISENFDNYFQSLHPLNYSGNPWFGEYWESIFNCSLKNLTEKEECDLDAQSLSSSSGYRQNSYVSYTIDAVYAFAHAIHKLQQDFCNGGPGLCSDIVELHSSGLAIRGELLRNYLLNNVSFPGTSSEIINFDESGDQEENQGYYVKNLQQKASGGEFEFKVVGEWDKVPVERSTSLDIFGEVHWSHGLGDDDIPESMCSLPCGSGEYSQAVRDQAACCWVCRPCVGANEISTGLECVECERGYVPNEERTACILVQPSYLVWSDVWSIVIVILASFGILASTFVALIFLIYHSHQLIKASSRELTAVLLTGILLCYLLPFFFIAKPSSWICAVRRFGVGFCFSLCYSALLVKTNRIHRIFNRPANSINAPPLVSPSSQLFFTALLVSIQVVVAIIWLTLERPGAINEYRKTSIELKCSESPIIGLLVALGYNSFLLLATIYFAFRARKVPQNFNEAKFINLTVYSLCILWLAFIPFYFGTAKLGTVYQSGSLVLAIILNATVTLCTLFVPKVYFLVSQLRKDRRCHSLETTAGCNYSVAQDRKLSLSLSLHTSLSTRAHLRCNMLTNGGNPPVITHCLNNFENGATPSDLCSPPSGDAKSKTRINKQEKANQSNTL